MDGGVYLGQVGFNGRFQRAVNADAHSTNSDVGSTYPTATATARWQPNSR